MARGKNITQKTVVPPNPRLQATPAAQPKLLKKQWRAVLFRGGRPWPRLREKTPDCGLGIPVKMVITTQKWPSGSPLAKSWHRKVTDAHCSGGRLSRQPLGGIQRMKAEA